MPEDISIVGFDDTDPMPDRRGMNQLTTVRLPLADVGREAARMVLRGVAGDSPPEEQVMLPTTLIVRGSTAPTAATNDRRRISQEGSPFPSS